MTNGRFQVLKFNDSFPAMNLKSGRSPGDPFRSVTFLQSGQSDKTRFWKLADYKAVVGDLTQSAKSGRKLSRVNGS
ncbi:hypothetical protein [Methylotuvimicrobium sp. KM1]|uniref:hypothetical protein n=1 Tax=Methylotuvimicrobium sp. KM1 TaxID=3377707 RepID=UPI00384BEF01